MYFILTDDRVLYTLTGEAYNPSHVPLVLGIITLCPMLRLVLFDSFYYVFISGTAALIIFISFQLACSPLYKYATISEIAFVGIFIVLQVIDTHKADLRTKNLF